MQEKEESLHTLHSFLTIYEDFFRVSFKSIPLTKLLEQYSLLHGRVRIHKNSELWYFFTPEHIDEWELFVLLEAKQALQKGTIQRESVPSALKDFAARKGMDLDYVKQRSLRGALEQMLFGFGLIETLLEDIHVKKITITSINSLVTTKLIHDLYGECYTNLLWKKDFLDSVISKLTVAGAKPEDSVIRIGNFTCTVRMKYRSGEKLTSVTIEIEK